MTYPNIRATATRWVGAILSLTLALVPAAHRGEGPAPSAQATPEIHELDLGQCLEEALENNHRRQASRFAVEIAEAQHRQALAGYWPQVGLKGGYEHLSSAPDFVFPASQVRVPAGTAMINVPAGVLGPNPVQIPVSTPAQTVPVPSQDVKLANPDSFTVSLDASWLLYDGGMRRGLSEQTQGLADIMKEEARRTDLEIADSVTRLYYGAVLARNVLDIGSVTLKKMEATLDLTATMYRGGSSRVMKTDWLDNKVMVETLRSMVVELERNAALAEAALANTMGLGWRSSVRPTDREIPFIPLSPDLEELVQTAYHFNPDWGEVEAGIRAAEGAVLTAKSEHLPRVAATGIAHRWWNTYQAGLATDNNKVGWAAGVGVELPLFSGFLTKSKVDEATAREEKIKAERQLLREGIGLEVKSAFLNLVAAAKAFQATRDAMEAAAEDSDLTTRAYQAEMVETEKVIRTQLLEALMTAQHLKARYDHVAAQAQIQLVVGKALTSENTPSN